MPRLTLVLALLLTACASPRPGAIDHAVFVWLKRPGNTADRAALVAATKQLQKTTGLIASFQHGSAIPSDRPVVDDSFDLALLMRFKDQRALTAFETHPAHLEAKKDLLQPLARKIVIYDIALE
jgi:hypothetical protein